VEVERSPITVTNVGLIIKGITVAPRFDSGDASHSPTKENIMRLSDGSKVYFSFVNLRGLDNKYRHPSIRFVSVDPARAQDTDDSLHGNILIEFQFQSNGDQPTDDWYAGSIEGLTSIDNIYTVRDINKILRAWERYLKTLSWERHSTHKRRILGFLLRNKIERVIPNPDRYNQWLLYR